MLCNLFGGTVLIQFVFPRKVAIIMPLFICAHSIILDSQYNATNITRENVSTYISMGENHQIVVTKPRNARPRFKYILLWLPENNTKIVWEMESNSFIKDNCAYTNCYFTYKKTRNLRKFHAILFHGSYLKPYYNIEIPKIRFPGQKYIFHQHESAFNYPLNDTKYDNFFNWTMTYKLDSDIFYTYFVIKNDAGETVGPNKNMKWIPQAHMKDVDVKFKEKLRSKTKAAAWFVSNCRPANRRGRFVVSLKTYLIKYNMTVDVYGKCGVLKCPRDQPHICNAMLEKDYYFYMSFENSFSEDYVTEKVLTALQNNVVPIVYGCADYTRFLPPGSYINARAYNASGLADLMYKLIRSKRKYSQYFKWKNHYTYEGGPVCTLCEALNDIARFRNITSHKQFLFWWNHNPCKKLSL